MIHLDVYECNKENFLVVLLFLRIMKEEKKDKKNNFWINTKNKLKQFKKTSIEKFHNDIENNSRIFFAVAKKLDEDTVIKSAIDNVETSITKKKSKGKKIFNTLFFVLNIVLIFLVFYNFAKEGVQPLSSLFASNPKWRFVWLALGLYVVTCLFNTLKFSFLIHNKTGKWRPWFSFKLATIGRYYDHVTPLGSGGQPFEIYYMKKNGYSGDISTAIPLAKYMVWQIAFIFLGLFILIFYAPKYNPSVLVIVCAWVGLGLTLSLFLFVMFMSLTKKWGASLVVGVLKLLHKMHIIKDYKKVLIKVLRFVKQYQYCMKTFAKSPWTLIGVFISSLGSLISNALIAYFIYISFTDVPVVNWYDIVFKCIICEMAVCFFPLPGGTGATELSFKNLLGSLFTEGTLFWGLLIWRILTYYLYILQGGVILLLDMFLRKKKGLKPIKFSSQDEDDNGETNTQENNMADVEKAILEDSTLGEEISMESNESISNQKETN